VHTDKLTVDARTYAAGRALPAYLIVPDGGGKRPAVIFVHGYGGSRSDFLAEGAGVGFLGVDAGLEDRLRGVVLQAPPAHLDGADADFDTIRYVRHAAPAWLYVQGAELDEGVPPRDVQSLIDAAPHPVEYKWYPTSHAFAPVTFRDQVAWLRDRLGLKGSAAK